MPLPVRYCTGCSDFQCGGLCGNGGEKYSFRKGMNRSKRAKLPYCCKGLPGPETFPPITTYSKDFTDVHHIPAHGVSLLIKSQLKHYQAKPIRSCRFITEYQRTFNFPSQECSPKPLRRKCINDAFRTQYEVSYVDHNNINCNTCCNESFDNCEYGQLMENQTHGNEYSFMNKNNNPFQLFPENSKMNSTSTCPSNQSPPQRQPRFQKHNLIKPGTDTVQCPKCPMPEINSICTSNNPNGGRNSCFDDLRKQVITPPRMYPPIRGLPKYITDPNAPKRRPSVLMYQTGSLDCPGPALPFPIKFEFTKTDNPGLPRETNDDYADSFYEYTIPAKVQPEEAEAEGTIQVTNDSIFPVPRNSKSDPDHKKGASKTSNQIRGEPDKINRKSSDPYKPANGSNAGIKLDSKSKTSIRQRGGASNPNSKESLDHKQSNKYSNNLSNNHSPNDVKKINQNQSNTQGSSIKRSNLNQANQDAQNSIKSNQTLYKSLKSVGNSRDSIQEPGSDLNSNKIESTSKKNSKVRFDIEPDPNTIVPKHITLPPPGIPPYCADLICHPKDRRPSFNHQSTYDVDYLWNKTVRYKRYGGEITDPIPVKPLCYPGTIKASELKQRSEERERFGEDWSPQW